MSRDYIEATNKIVELVKKKYIEKLEYFDKKYNFDKIAEFIAEIDFVKSNAKTAKLYGYCKPSIVHNNRSFIDAIDVRHPIIERIDINTNYIPNDVFLSKDNIDGMLLYCLNSGGKSSYMKSVGLNIILAQMGSFVAAKEFKFFPYTKIFTRISGDDNIFYGQSSFAVEMSELRSILKFSDQRSLVLGDEICRGTETVSALALVSSAINKFSINKVNFIFATHLHKLSEMNCIKSLHNIGLYHLLVDTSNGKLEYKRKLEKGSGESIYGIEVAKHLIDDKDFINFAYNIRNELLNISDYILHPKTSKYNTNIFVDKCQIDNCNKNYKNEQLDVHHILFQSQCNNNDLIDHIRKNDKSNLVVLCKEHHSQVHNKNLEIYGYIDTENGKKLDYKFIDKKDFENKKKNRLKYNSNQISIIKQFKNNNKPINYILKKLKDDYNINIGRSTLNKIFNDQYGI
jgi:DNA mismatch repair protein MutS